MKIQVIQNSDCITVGSENFYLTLWLENNMWLMTVEAEYSKDDHLIPSKDPLFFVNFKRAMDHAEKLLEKLENDLEAYECDAYYASIIHEDDITSDWKEEIH